MSSPARAGTSAVLAVLAAAGLLLVLVTWAASIGPDQVVSGGHVDRVSHDDPTASTQAASGGTNPLDELRDKKRGEPPGWLGAVALGLELLTAAVVLFLLGRLARRVRRAWRERTRRRGGGADEVAFEVLGSAAMVTEAMTDDAGSSGRSWPSMPSRATRSSGAGTASRSRRSGPGWSGGRGRPPPSSCSACSTSWAPTAEP